VTSVSDVPAADTGPTPPSELHGLRIWVTGAGRGLGRAVAADLSRAGALVALTARSPQGLADATDECGDGAIALPGSVADEQDLARATDTIGARWGGLDALVHLAGISPVFQPADRLDAATWREIVEINLTGTFLACQAAAAVMDGPGAIVTTSSVHARTGAGRLAAYSATKGGIESLTRSLALDWASRGIRVNCLAPGYFETDMTQDLRHSTRQNERLLARIPQGRMGTPRQITDVVRLLVGPGGSYITGSVISVDGGWSAA
jgi:NAD(P)-dependent dehydrogenase (short-subunit alcohol dehydrogenase family)